jgi:phosphohistidine phosphatase SixA
MARDYRSRIERFHTIHTREPAVDVFLLRTSLTEGDASAPEAHRFLSAEGRQIVRALGNKLRLSDEPSFTRFFVSPLAAAAQTAELFADRVDYVGIVEVVPALAGGVPAQVLVPPLLARGGESFVIVGDEPALSSIGAFIVGRPTFPPLVPSQVSVIRDRQPGWCLKPGEPARSQLLVS